MPFNLYEFPSDNIASTGSSLPRPCSMMLRVLFNFKESVELKLNNMVRPTPESKIKFNSIPFTSMGKMVRLLINLKDKDTFFCEGLSNINEPCPFTESIPNAIKKINNI